MAFAAADVAFSGEAVVVAAVRMRSEKASTESLAGGRAGELARLERTSETARWARFRTWKILGWLAQSCGMDALKHPSTVAAPPELGRVC
jgi:hypothetical protein